jgi:hypothetical protein
MGVKNTDKHFRLTKITHLDFKTVEMDRALTLLCARLKFDGCESRLGKDRLSTVDDFVAQFLEKKDLFTGFDKHTDIVRGWIETHLLDLVNRGRANQQVAAPRPLHGLTYRFRNPKHCRDYYVSGQLYEMLWNARNRRGELALSMLKQFFFEGVDQNTGFADDKVKIDVETQALMSAVSRTDATYDAEDSSSRDRSPPLCVGSADLLADDVLRLLAYRKVIPRSVMVDYLKILFAFHLSLYHFRLLKMLPAIVKLKGTVPSCAVARCPVKPLDLEQPHGDCPYRVKIFVDIQNRPDRRTYELAAQSAEDQFRRIPAFIRAHFLVKKLDEFGDSLRQMGRMRGPDGGLLTIWQTIQLLGNTWDTDREAYFFSRLTRFIEDNQGDNQELDPEIQDVMNLKLPHMEAFIECLVAMRMTYHRKFVTGSLDSLSLKNRPGALMAQARAPKSPRRFVLDSRLLEVLLQVAVLSYDSGAKSFVTTEIRIEELIGFLRERYGIHIDSLPTGEGFAEPTIQDREALRDNKKAFMGRLREIGFFQDLSDAYITQHVTPRYRLDGPVPTMGGTHK